MKFQSKLVVFLITCVCSDARISSSKHGHEEKGISQDDRSRKLVTSPDPTQLQCAGDCVLRDFTDIHVACGNGSSSCSGKIPKSVNANDENEKYNVRCCYDQSRPSSLTYPCDYWIGGHYVTCPTSKGSQTCDYYCPAPHVKKSQCDVWADSVIPTKERAPYGDYIYHLYGCQAAKTFTEAVGLCEKDGGRLCTREEVDNKCAKDSGCGFDSELIWTSPLPLLLQCEGDCDSDDDCEDGLTCFERDDFTAVPGCQGAGVEGRNYCIPTIPYLEYIGANPIETLAQCQGDCDADDDCADGLFCFYRSSGSLTKVPGCLTGGSDDRSGTDYCTAGEYPHLKYIGVDPTETLAQCQGDCDADDDCADGLFCFHRSTGSLTKVPGCQTGGSDDISGTDYCTAGERLITVGHNPTQKLNECEGDCDSDDDCSGSLRCFQRSDDAQVPGCQVGGTGDAAGRDYCTSKKFLYYEGATPDKPMQECEGDCDSDNDCQGDLVCFHRHDGTDIPGCYQGGPADAEGRDFCASTDALEETHSVGGCTVREDSEDFGLWNHHVTKYCHDDEYVVGYKCTCSHSTKFKGNPSGLMTKKWDGQDDKFYVSGVKCECQGTDEEHSSGRIEALVYCKKRTEVGPLTVTENSDKVTIYESNDNGRVSASCPPGKTIYNFECMFDEYSSSHRVITGDTGVNHRDKYIEEYMPFQDFNDEYTAVCYMGLLANGSAENTPVRIKIQCEDSICTN